MRMRTVVGACFFMLGQAAWGQSLDQAFAATALQHGRAEVELGRMAQSRGHSPEVREFGARMVDEHGSANRQLAALAEQYGLSAPPGIGAERELLNKELSTLSGVLFDRRYMQAQVETHRTAIDLFQRQSQLGQVPALRNYAQEQLPVLQDHLAAAERMTEPDDDPRARPSRERGRFGTGVEEPETGVGRFAPSRDETL